MTEPISSLKPESFKLFSHFVSNPLPNDLSICSLARGECLCCEGDEKAAVWRLESGILYSTQRRESGPPEFVELALPGSVLGLGFLTHQAHNITALVASRVSVWPRTVLSDLFALAPDDPKLKQLQARQDHAIDREFAYRRRQLVTANLASPLRRTAAFVVSMSRLNSAEGRNPDRMSEKLQVDAVANFLGMHLDVLADSLAELWSRGLVAADSLGGLHLLDVAALERFASENDPTVPESRMAEPDLLLERQ